ncbi:RNA polymerase-binding transcription factor DksA [bacterium HR34]|mgnify:CR=1 FL=1|nr:RNA polymerase-binding transcription factor DksA [bacterium HR34]
MNNNTIKEIKQNLEDELEKVRQELSKIAYEEDGRWTTKFPEQSLEGSHQEPTEAADEVEDYTAMLKIKESLEKRYNEIKEALQKIEKGSYGKCEKCGQEISEKRLKANPTAKYCIKCA